MTRPVALFILDGWGIRETEEGNAVQLAQTPHYDRWLASYERAILDASGEAVGLPDGQMGNSEVGHLNLGAGRIVYQDITRINIAIRENELTSIPQLAEALAEVKKNGRKVHLIGLLGPGGVHSHQDHMHALLDAAAEAGAQTIVHVITDGRDTPPNSGLGYLTKLMDKMKETGGTIASVTGRYYAMDRDKRWERTAAAYQAIANHQADREFETAIDALQTSYDAGTTDEFVKPSIIKTSQNVRVEAGDCLLFFNFRADRMRQIVRPFVIPEFDGFERAWIPDLIPLSLTRYADDLPTRIMFQEQGIPDVLAEVISRAGLPQLHAAETEKYPHVTFFFNGGEETPYPQESRILVNSPKVATYDLQPEMSAPALTEQVLAHLQNEKPAFILVNYANPDMVGHTGDLQAAIKAVEAVDHLASKLVNEILAQDGIAFVTADHGNCERMVELLTGEPHTYHTTNPVSFIAIRNEYVLLRPRGILADVAPTILEALGVEQPASMTGRSLFQTS